MPSDQAWSKEQVFNTAATQGMYLFDFIKRHGWLEEIPPILFESLDAEYIKKYGERFRRSEPTPRISQSPEDNFQGGLGAVRTVTPGLTTAGSGSSNNTAGSAEEPQCDNSRMALPEHGLLTSPSSQSPKAGSSSPKKKRGRPLGQKNYSATNPRPPKIPKKRGRPKKDPNASPKGKRQPRVSDANAATRVERVGEMKRSKSSKQAQEASAPQRSHVEQQPLPTGLSEVNSIGGQYRTIAPAPRPITDMPPQAAPQPDPQPAQAIGRGQSETADGTNSIALSAQINQVEPMENTCNPSVNPGVTAPPSFHMGVDPWSNLDLHASTQESMESLDYPPLDMSQYPAPDDLQEKTGGPYFQKTGIASDPSYDLSFTDFDYYNWVKQDNEIEA